MSTALDRFRLLKPVEWVLTGYLVYTGSFVVFYHQHFDHPFILLAFRFILIACFVIMAGLKPNKPFIEFIRFIAPILLLSYLYGETDLFNNLIFHDYFDPKISRYDALIFGSQPSLTFATTFHSAMFSELMHFGYFSYYLMIICVPLFFYFKGWKNISEKITFLMINSFLVYYVIFIIFPVAGPQYYFESLIADKVQGGIFTRFIQLIQSMGEKPTGAFPSSHVSICIMILWICLQYKKALFYIFLPVSPLLILSTVYIGAHYCIDVIAAIVFTPVVYMFSLSVYNRFYHRSINLLNAYGYRNN